jgi:hypothetical protein
VRVTISGHGWMEGLGERWHYCAGNDIGSRTHGGGIRHEEERDKVSHGNKNKQRKRLGGSTQGFHVLFFTIRLE